MENLRFRLSINVCDPWTAVVSSDWIAAWAVSVVETLGHVGVGLLVALENLIPPIPSEVVLPLAGFVAADNHSSPLWMVLAATAGSLAGAYALYGVAAAIGPWRLQRLVTGYGRWFGLSPGDLDRAEAWFDRWSSTAVLVCRCIPLMRSLISIPAGLRRMRLVPFTVYTLAGSLVWNSALIGAGYLLGDNWQRAGEPVELLQGIVIGALVVAAAWFVWHRLLAPRRRSPLHRG